MSDVVEKTFASIPKFFSQNLLGSAVGGPQSPKKYAVRSFHNFLNQMARTQTKSEEERIVKQELSLIQQKLSQPDISKQQICDCLFKLIYCNILGHDVSFGHIHAVKMAQQGSAIEKKMGYLSVALFLDEDHDLILLLINTIQKDLHSTNILDICIALTAVCWLVNSEMIPMVMPVVKEKLKHPRELVRTKAACCLERFITKVPSLLPHLEDDLWKAMCDKDIGVTSIAVGIYLKLIQKNPENYSKVFDSLLNVLQQIISGKLPNSFEYHSIPMPWLQIKILRALAIFGQNDRGRSEAMYSTLNTILQKTSQREKIAYAIIFECIVTITTIFPHSELLKEAANHVKKFVSSQKYILKYIGVKALTYLIRASPEAALSCQMMVVELLDDPYPAIQRKTVDLLYSMANSSNVQVICERLLGHLKHEENEYQQAELVRKVLNLVDRFSPSRQWYFDVILTLLGTCRTSLPNDIVNTVTSVISQGFESDGEVSQQTKDYKQHLVKRAIESLFKENCSEELIQICVWIMGELAVFLKNMPEDRVVSLIKKHFIRSSVGAYTKLWIVSSVCKLYSAKVIKSETVKSNFCVLDQKDESVLIKQKLRELENLCDINGTDPEIWTNKKKTELHQMDFTLSHLDEFVVASLEAGATPYKHRILRIPQVATDISELFSNIEDNQLTHKEELLSLSGKGTHTSYSSENTSEGSERKRDSGLKMQGIRKVWGKQGRITDDTVEDRSEGPGQDISEIERKRQLAAALFSGISPNKGNENEQNEKPEGDLESGIYNATGFKDDNTVCEQTDSLSTLLPSNDKAGWRSLHDKSLCTPLCDGSFDSQREHNSTPVNNTISQDMLNNTIHADDDFLPGSKGLGDFDPNNTTQNETFLLEGDGRNLESQEKNQRDNEDSHSDSLINSNKEYDHN